MTDGDTFRNFKKQKPATLQRVGAEAWRVYCRYYTINGGKMSVVIKCGSCGTEVQAELGKWVKCQCGCNLKPEYRLVVHHGKDE